MVCEVIILAFLDVTITDADCVLDTIDVKNVFYVFYKSLKNMFFMFFLFFNVFVSFSLHCFLPFVLKTSTHKITNMMQFILENCGEHVLVVI